MATYDELIAANYTVEEIRGKTGADSLGYLSLAGLIASVGRDRSEMCLGCFVGEYPNVPAGHQARASTSSAQASTSSAQASTSSPQASLA
jgi:amidophosphoribosyltransferase